MKLASLKRGGRDGTLIVVDRSLRIAATAPKIARTLQQALDDWEAVAPGLRDVYELLNAGGVATSFAFKPAELAAPLPRAFQWLDASAYLSHVELVRKARGAEMPERFRVDPLMYQGGSDGFLGSCDPIELVDEAWGLDFEAEVAAITDDVPIGVTPRDAAARIRLLCLVNDVSLRNLIPDELAKGFGFVHGKPASALSPVAVTPDELGEAWRGSKLCLPLVTELNGTRFGDPDAGTDMQFDFSELVAHAAKTRRLGAGTIVGSGTVSNRDPRRGASCIVERRTREQIETGAARTPYLRAGDQVRIEIRDATGASIFGAIDQRVVEVGA